MAVITFPTGGIRRVSWTNPQHPDFAVKSGWTKKTQIVDLGATEGFRAEVEVIPGKAAHLYTWRAFFALMKGRTNTTLVNAVPGASSVVGAVNGAGQTGNTINVDGLAVSSTLRKAGQLINIATSSADWRMFTLTADLVTNGSGQAAMAIEPSVDVAYVDNAGVQISAATCHMRLASPVTGWSEEPGAIYRPFSFTLEEVI